MKNKAQATSIIIFFGLILAIFLMAFILMKFTNSILTPFSTSIGNVSNGGTQAAAAVNAVHTKFTSMWDWVIIIIFIINVLILFVSAFLVDIHPAFLFLYVISAFFLVIFGSTVVGTVQDIMDSSQFATEKGQMPMVEFMINNWTVVMLGIIFVSGVLMYAKIKFGTSQATGGY